jgi:hypothetical protein
MASAFTTAARSCERAHKDDTRHESEAVMGSTQCQQTPNDIPEPRLEEAHQISSGPDDKYATENLRDASNCPPHSQNPASGLFTHHPLQLNTGSIRLVDILTPDADGTIRCSIRHTQISEPSINAEYTCLSYAWGSANTTHSISMNGKPMEVGDNLWEFLRAVSASKWRNEEPRNHRRIGIWHRNLWIDALCIDQTNGKEKNHQVQQMGRIYQGANEVIAWLGSDESTAALFNYEEEDIRGTHGSTTKKSQVLYDLYQDLGKITYWNRAWVVQEVLLAKEVYFLSRENSIRLHDLKRVGEALGVLASLSEVAGLLNLVAGFSMTVRPLNLIEIVELFRKKGCKDVRDRIYSVLSISDDGEKLPVKYDSSMVELARSALRLYKDGVCLANVFTMLQVVELGSKALGMESCSPFIGLHGSKTLRHISPCTQCGETQETSPQSISLPTVTEARFICLHCNHSGTFAPTGVHKVRHLGHLCLVQGTALNSGSCDWHLFWIPFGGVFWRNVVSQKYLLTTQDGAFRVLLLSVALVCELMELISLEKSRDVEYHHALVERRYRSFWRTKWTVVRQLDGSTPVKRVSEIIASLSTTQD